MSDKPYKLQSSEKLLEMHILGGKAVIFDQDAVNELYSKHFFGKPFGVKKPRSGERFKGPLEISLLESLYICEKGIAIPLLNLKKISCEDLRQYAASQDPRFRETYQVFRDLRDRGFIVRSGMKYGVDFTVYEKGPGMEHAPYLVQVMKYDEQINPIYIVRVGRLSHSVRKTLIIAVVYDSTIKYISFGWIKF
ncbi:MAG: tRNA-intron lyase [Sulfolobales archaeon]